MKTMEGWSAKEGWSSADMRTERTGSALRSPIIVTLVCLCAFAILIGLGLWQLQRKAWKEDLLARMGSRLHEASIPLPSEAEWPRWQAEQDEFRRVTLQGVFLHEAESPVYGTFASQRGDSLQGFYLLTPLRLTDGSIVFVERGFIPQALLNRSARPDSLPATEVTLEGVMRAPQLRGTFTPVDDGNKNLWFTRDPLAMAKAQGLMRVAPFYVQAKSLKQPYDWLKSAPVRPELLNNHLQYALTWFGLAGALACVLTAQMRRCSFAKYILSKLYSYN